MNHAYRYRARPEQTGVTPTIERQVDIHRQGYNYTKYEYENLDSDEHDVGSTYQHHGRLTDWKEEFPVFSEVNARALQCTVKRFYDNLSRLSGKKEKGYKVGELKWKAPHEYRSITYSQHGFELKNTSGQDNAILYLNKIGDIPIEYHREIPDHATIKEVTIKKERTGEWFVSFGVEVDNADLPDKPDIDTLEADDVVGIDLGILNYIHTSDGIAVEGLDLDAEYERLAKAQRVQSRREKGSNNWEKARKRVANAKRRIRRKVLDYQHKLSTWLVKEYDAVFVEDLDVKPMLEQSQNAKNKQDAAWARFIELLEYKGKLYGTRVEAVEPAGTTKECSQCGVSTDKPIWVREHSCPSCGFELDRDWNAALNVLQRGLAVLGLGQSEVERLMETGAAAGDSAKVVEVSASTVNEAGNLRESKGSPVLSEPATAGE